MTRRTYTPEHKAKLVIEVLQGEKELNTIAAENSISPNMLRNWKAEFLENASRAFDGSRQAKEARRKEADLKKTQAQMLKTIGQLTLERDFLQDCFRAAGHPIPKLPTYVDQNRSPDLFRSVESLDEVFHVVSVDRTVIVKAQVIEH